MGEWNQLYFCKLLNMTSLTCDNLIFLFLAYRFYPVYYEPNFCLHLHAGYPCAPVPRWPSDNKNTTFRPWDPPEGCIRSVEVVGYGLARRKYTRVGPRGNVFMNAKTSDETRSCQKVAVSYPLIIVGQQPPLCATRGQRERW